MDDPIISLTKQVVDGMNIKGSGLIFIHLNDGLSQLISALFGIKFHICGAYFTSSVSGYPQTHVILTDGLPQYLLSPMSRSILLKDLIQMPFIGQIMIRPFILTNDSVFRLAIAEVTKSTSYDIKSIVKDYFSLSFEHYQKTIINCLSENCRTKGEDDIFGNPIDVKVVTSIEGKDLYRSYLVKVVSCIIDLLLTDTTFIKSIQDQIYSSENISHVWEILTDLIITGEVKYDVLLSLSSRYGVTLPELTHNRLIILRAQQHDSLDPLTRLTKFTQDLLRYEKKDIPIVNLSELIDITNKLTGSHIKVDHTLSYQAIVSMTPFDSHIHTDICGIIPSHGADLTHLTIDELRALAHKLDEVTGFDELRASVSHRLAVIAKDI